uniref:Uncharacterized protein n=1 Tax=Arundo donax TaxID=35708 RepID=A0A0A9DJI7_ARUDO
MAYVERGVVKDKRTVWRLSIISDFFRAVVNFIRMFFLTMFSVEKTDSYKKGYGAGKKMGWWTWWRFWTGPIWWRWWRRRRFPWSSHTI